jgi:hypothetical protein
VARVEIHGAFVEQISEATLTEAVVIPKREVAAKLIDGDLQHEAGWVEWAGVDGIGGAAE